MRVLPRFFLDYLIFLISYPSEKIEIFNVIYLFFIYFLLLRFFIYIMMNIRLLPCIFFMFHIYFFLYSPVIQTCLVPLHFPGPVESPSLHINMYTAPAMFASILAFINLLLVMFVFKEHKADGLEEAGIASQIQKVDDEEEAANGHAINADGE